MHTATATTTTPTRPVELLAPPRVRTGPPMQGRCGVRHTPHRARRRVCHSSQRKHYHTHIRTALQPASEAGALFVQMWTVRPRSPAMPRGNAHGGGAGGAGQPAPDTHTHLNGSKLAPHGACASHLEGVGTAPLVTAATLAASHVDPAAVTVGAGATADMGGESADTTAARRLTIS